MQKILIIQTAFIGDVVLSTALIEKLINYFPDAHIEFLVRKGNENLLANNPNLKSVLIWDKKKSKYKNLFQLLNTIRINEYDKVINVQRYFATGFLTAFSGAKEKIGFDSNPLSFLFTKKIKHELKSNSSRHEVERNNDLIASFTDYKLIKPKLFPSQSDFNAIEKYNTSHYITISPTSVWFTKQFPKEKWISFINQIEEKFTIYLLGGPDNKKECEDIRLAVKHKNIFTLAGKLSFLQSAALMKSATMNFANDSAPVHFASAMNAPITAVFCSTIPAFGYGPLSDKSFIVETQKQLTCRPCGSHGKKVCPEKHFNCGNQIEVKHLIEILNRN